MTKNISLGLFILRVSTGFLILLHGIAKLKKGISGIEKMLADQGIPGFLANLVFLGEVIAPILMIIGWRTRIASLFVGVTMVVAVWLRHLEDINQLNRGGGWAIELPALFFFASLTLFITGGGKYAVSHNKKWD